MNTLPAVQRACELVELLGCGEVVDGVIDVLSQVTKPPRSLKLEPEKINALLGTDAARGRDLIARDPSLTSALSLSGDRHYLCPPGAATWSGL